MWEIPEAAVVTTSAKWTEAEAKAGATPNANNKDVDVTPYAIPNEPSIN
ncbi:hypothetical protein GCM10011571_31360 [Marinithermofilum abyssi]|uniref:Uncharacterized protein n=1 Tax=Marinithermofilum abyssi TaxID=1571185 RepID=A0A8J2Y9R3_9BACL|nr:hypothetical protein GCM10011571_31360 [Marinithermofilum abyssi]